MKNRRENDMIYCSGKKAIYIHIGYKSAPMMLKLTSDEKILKIKRFL